MGGLKIRYTTISWIFLCFLCIPLAYFQEVTHAGFIVNRICQLSLIYAVYLLVSQNVRLEKHINWLVIFAIWHFIAGLLNSNTLDSSFSLMYKSLVVIVLTKHILQNNIERGLSSLVTLMGGALILNTITKILPFSVMIDGREVYFIGSRISLSDVFLYACSIAFIYTVLYKRRYAFTILTVISGVYFVIIESVSTAIMTITVFVLVFLYLRIANRILANRRNQTVFVTIVIITCLYFVFYSRNGTNLGWLLEGFLKEDLTFNGRTILWEKALEKIEGVHWIIGYGLSHGQWFELPNGFAATTAHSQYINIVFRSGVIGLTFYILAIYKMLRDSFNVHILSYRYILVSSICAFWVTGISTTTYESFFMYVWMTTIYQLNRNYLCQEDIIVNA